MVALIQITQAVPIDGATAMSVSLVVIVLAAAWKISSILTRIEEKLSNALEKLSLLADHPERMGRFEERLGAVEREVAALWEINERRSA